MVLKKYYHNINEKTHLAGRLGEYFLMGVDIKIYLQKYPKEQVLKLYEYATKLGLAELVNTTTTNEELCSFGSGQEFLIPYFEYGNEEYTEKEISLEKIKTLNKLLKNILMECDNVVYNETTNHLFKTKTYLNDTVVYAKKSIITSDKCNEICDKKLEQYKFKVNDYIKNVKYEFIYPIKFLDVCIVYNSLRKILNCNKKRKIFMTASF